MKNVFKQYRTSQFLNPSHLFPILCRLISDSLKMTTSRNNCERDEAAETKNDQKLNTSCPTNAKPEPCPQQSAIHNMIFN